MHQLHTILESGYNNENHTPLHVAVFEVHGLDKSLGNRLKEIKTTAQSAKSPAQRRASIANLDGKITTLQRAETDTYNGMNGEAKDRERDARRKAVISFLEDIQEKLKENGDIERISKLLLEIHPYDNAGQSAGQNGMSQVVEELIKICKEALFVASSSITKLLRTPYQRSIFEFRMLFPPYVSQNTTVSKELEEYAFRSVVIGDPIASTISLCCLHNFTRDEITKCLYHPGQGLPAHIRIFHEAGD
ncbi:hypothetical protein J3459_017147 [Metarhizium acridum]|nr:hypothetical protein J3459_017147 [Metarhizium acridum]